MDRSEYRILLADDEELFRTQIASLLKEEGFNVEMASDGVAAINIIRENAFDLILLDYHMPKVNGMEVLQFVKDKHPATEVIIITGTGDVSTAVESMKIGAYDYVMKPILVAADFLQIISRALEHHDLLATNSALQSEITRLSGKMEIVGSSEGINGVLELARRVAPTDTNVLIQGASGTGKELVANFICKNSDRKSNPFVTINCASIPDTLIESEIFGYEKGAFTDARSQKQGLAELANKGTLFLDEVGDISAIIQPKLLRFIQTGEFRRVGGNAVHKADVRIISATNKDLREEVAQGRFREDLLYRLNVVTLAIPPLRERKEDIPHLVDNFLQWKFRRGVKKSLTPRAMELLMEYDWPGNVRELENVIESSVILSHDALIQPEDILLPAAARKLGAPPDPPADSSSPSSLKDLERVHISQTLDYAGWDKKAASKILGISLKTLYTKIAQYNLRRH